MRSTRHIKRFVAALTAVSAVGGIAFVPVSQGDLQNQIAAQQSQPASWRSRSNPRNANIAQTSGDVATARAQLTSVEHKLSADLSKLRTTPDPADDRAGSSRPARGEGSSRPRMTWSTNLRAEYEGATPNLVTVILNSHGFTQLLNQVNFAQRISKQGRPHRRHDAHGAQAGAQRDPAAWANLEQRDKSLTDSILGPAQPGRRPGDLAAEPPDRRDPRPAPIPAASWPASSRPRRPCSRSSPHSRPSSRRSARPRPPRPARARSRRRSRSTSRPAVWPSTRPAWSRPPAGAPAAVKEMIDAGNAIATLPYIWGGGHGSFISPGYDCSGSVSYVLAAAGLLSASGGLRRLRVLRRSGSRSVGHHLRNRRSRVDDHRRLALLTPSPCRRTAAAGPRAAASSPASSCVTRRPLAPARPASSPRTDWARLGPGLRQVIRIGP